ARRLDAVPLGGTIVIRFARDVLRQAVVDVRRCTRAVVGGRRVGWWLVRCRPDGDRCRARSAVATAAIGVCAAVGRWTLAGGRGTAAAADDRGRAIVTLAAIAALLTRQLGARCALPVLGVLAGWRRPRLRTSFTRGASRRSRR